MIWCLFDAQADKEKEGVSYYLIRTMRMYAKAKYWGFPAIPVLSDGQS